MVKQLLTLERQTTNQTTKKSDPMEPPLEQFQEKWKPVFRTKLRQTMG
jgi:hypothetical protein